MLFLLFDKCIQMAFIAVVFINATLHGEGGSEQLRLRSPSRAPEKGRVEASSSESSRFETTRDECPLQSRSTRYSRLGIVREPRENPRRLASSEVTVQTGEGRQR